MTDCYRVLGVLRTATSAEIRAAYLAKMKRLHPDAARYRVDGADARDEAAEINFAYWQLRDGERRAAHDALLETLLLAPPPSPARARRRRSSRRRSTEVARRTSSDPAAASRTEAKPVVGARSGPRRATRRMRRLQAVAGVAAFAFAVGGFWAAFTQFGQSGQPIAQAATIFDAPVRSVSLLLRNAPDPAIADAAENEFRLIVARSGIEGAHAWARQCLMELAARPSLPLLDQCRAFEAAAAQWETGEGRGRPRRYFAPDQRYGRFTGVARSLAPGRVRETILAEVDHFSDDSGQTAMLRPANTPRND